MAERLIQSFLTTLAAPLTEGGTSCTVTAGVPADMVGHSSRMVFWDSPGGNREFVYATFVTTTSWALIRAVEESGRFPARAWAPATRAEGVATKQYFESVAAGYEATTLYYGADRTGAADSTDAILDAVAAVPLGGRLYNPTGRYVVSDTLDFGDRDFTFLGGGFTQDHGSIAANGINVLNLPINPPYLRGTVFDMQTAGKTVIKVPAVGKSVHLGGFGITFASGIRFGNTGAAVIDATPGASYLSRPEMGLHSSNWYDIAVFGHGGNTYAYRLVNQLCCNHRKLRFYGGGGMHFKNDSGASNGNFGNLLSDDFYGQLFCQGTAHGFLIEAATGFPNMFEFNRCQITTDNLTAVFPTTVAPMASQYCFYCDDNVRRITWVQGDFESNVGGKLRFPTTGFSWDVAGILSHIPEGGGGPIVTPTGTRYPVRKSNDYGNRVEYSNLDFGVDILTAGESPMGWRFKPTSRIVGISPEDGALVGGFWTDAPRCSPRRAGIGANEPLRPSNIYVSNGTNWNDVEAATTIALPSAISGYAFDVIPSDEGVASGNPLDVLTNWPGGSFTNSGAARATYTTAVATPNGKGSAFFDGVDDVMISAALSANPASLTYFFVVYFATLPGGGFGHADLFLGDGNGARVRIRNSPAGRIGFEKQGWFGFPDSSYSIPVGRFTLIVVRYDSISGDLTYRCDSTLMGTTNSVQPLTASTARLGGGAPFYLARFLGYQHATTAAGALSDADVLSVEKLLRTWGQLP